MNFNDHPEIGSAGQAAGLWCLYPTTTEKGIMKQLRTYLTVIMLAGIMEYPLEGVEPLSLTCFGVQDVTGTTAKVGRLSDRALLAPAATVT